MGMSEAIKQKRPEFRNIHVSQIVSYRLPPAGIVSILHRVSGVLMFLLLPLVIWLFDKSVTSEISYGDFTTAFAMGVSFVPGWLLKLVVLALIWGYLFHFTAGLRHLWMDMTHAVTKSFGHSSAITVIVISTLLTIALGYKLFF